VHSRDESLDGAACAEFFHLNGLPPPDGHASLDAYWQALPWDRREECAWTLETLGEGLRAFLAAARTAGEMAPPVSFEVRRGIGKDGTPERFDLTFRPGDIVAIVGPTGSGKSRLLADIECMAQGDTPSRRTVLVDGRAPDRRMRFTAEGRLVAQITQNMNFVMDLRVADFLCLHAESRQADNPADAARRVLDAAVGMAGEPFTGATPLTQLSGGQSRALMIADAALLSPKPVVLIDEIENAGVDRTRALKLFTDKGKIVLLSTHDPLLALSGVRRLVINNGAIKAVTETSAEERHYCHVLQGYEQRLGAIRDAVRHGRDLAPAWSDFTCG
jgi:ABC-type antimicrobial peptide transport system, ATPase component